VIEWMVGGAQDRVVGRPGLAEKCEAVKAEEGRGGDRVDCEPREGLLECDRIRGGRGVWVR